jgi:hypothetical protein
MATARVLRARTTAAPLLFILFVAAAFVIARPPVGDLWAARARASAAAHGVGLHYWFSWFDGTVPGHYSVLAPYLTRIVDVTVLGAIATTGVIAMCRRLVRDSRHPAIATWLGAVATGFSLWSGRVPFALGTALAVVALLAVLTKRTAAAAVAGALTALVSPVCAVFLMLGLTGVLVHVAGRRTVALCAVVAAAVPLAGVAAYFGLPGPEGFPIVQAAGAAGAIGVMMLARPAPYVRTVLAISLGASLLLTVVPNGLGSNFERFVWIWLPVAVAATARARPSLTALVGAAAVMLGIIGSTKDLVVAAQPLSQPSYFSNLIRELDRTPALTNYRLEAVPDGAHVATYALLDHAMLARGFETQTDNKLNGVLQSASLTAAGYRAWLDENAVGYVLIDRSTLASGPEDKLVRAGNLPYLHEFWSDAHWRLFEVSAANPIAARPARIVDADQASITIATPGAGTFPLRIRWSRFLRIRSARGDAARVEPDGEGWTTLVTRRPGTFVISG